MIQRFRLIFFAAFIFVFSATLASAQSGTVRDRITRPIERISTVRVSGNVHPFTRTSADAGEVAGGLPMNRITMVFQQTAQQEAALETLLAQQQGPASPNYHHWLTPEEFAGNFGLSANDVVQVVTWLQSQGFTVDEVARSRQWVTFSGTAKLVEAAFQTNIHQFTRIDGSYYANVTEPAIPPALQNIVLGFRGLNNFRLRARPHPRFTSSVSGSHYLSPNDFATIYDLNGLYAKGLNGSGQSIAVMGQTDLPLADIAAFRSASGLPAMTPNVILVPGSTDPGISQNDLPEADLDVEWSGAVAPNAQIIFVNSGNGAFDSMQYAVDQNLAPVVSISYGDCEAAFSSQEINAVAAITSQGNAQGITIVAAAGDDGAADCDTNAVATQGLAVDVPASIPYVTGVGGTQFQDTAANWSTTNNSDNGSALSYIPEIVWNDTTLEGTLDATGGGRSVIFSKPTWQTGTGVPNDGARDVPDVALNASDAHDGYLVCSGGSCTSGFRASNQSLFVVGGTSAGVPTFAGMVALINQSTQSKQGNVNPKLYQLAASSPSVFHDITSGNNEVPCQAKTTGCPNGGTIGYSAGVGYDQTTGLGTLDAGNLIAAWNPSTTAPLAITSVSPSQGPTVGGSLITIAGTDFQGNSAVTIGGASATVISETATAMQVITPAGSAGTATLVVVNPGGQSVASSYTYSSAAVSQLQLTLAGNGSTYAESAGTATTVQVGYGVVNPATGVAILRSFSAGQLVSEASVPPTPAANQWTMYAEYDGPGTGVSTGIAIANPGSSAASLTLTLSNGSQTTVQLAAGSQRAAFVNEFFPSLSSFIGTLTVNSSAVVSIVALRGTTNQSGQFIISTIPVSSGSSSTGGFYAFPIVADGGGYSTDVILVNSGTTTSSGSISFSEALATSLGTNSSFAFTIPAGGMWRLQTSGTPASVNSIYASMSVTTGSPTPSATAIMRLRSGTNLISETAVPAQSEISNGMMFGALETNLRTGIAMLNGNPQAVQVTLTPTAANGQAVGGPATITVPAYSNLSKFLDEMIPTLPTGFQGTVMIQTSAPIWMISLRGSTSANGFIMSTTPVLNLSQSYSGTYYFPQIVDGGGYTTAFLTANAGSGNVSLQFFANSGQAMGLSLNN